MSIDKLDLQSPAIVLENIQRIANLYPNYITETAEGKADFIHKLAIAKKECNETLYWLELLQATDFLNKNEFDSLWGYGTELLKLITSIIKTTKPRIKH
ncbi:MAG: four helix bundle protein [Salinivirgaceae bacterium]|nr:four helix bundle protein [Salinivirgaceae bacterium]